jgi:hypothetical protein
MERKAKIIRLEPDNLKTGNLSEHGRKALPDGLQGLGDQSIIRISTKFQAPNNK